MVLRLCGHKDFGILWVSIEGVRGTAVVAAVTSATISSVVKAAALAIAAVFRTAAVLAAALAVEAAALASSKPPE